MQRIQKTDSNLNELLVSRILAGYLFFRNGIKVFSPFLFEQYRSEVIYQQVYEEALNEGLLEEQDVLDILVETDQWNEQLEYRLNVKVVDDIENVKIDMYKLYFQSTQREQLRRNLNKLKEEQSNLYSLRHSYDSYSCQGISNYVKWQWTIKHSTFLDSSQSDLKQHNLKPYNFKKYSLDKVLQFYQQNIIGEKKIRELARTEPWKSVWSALKQNGKIFDKLTTEQVRLIQYSSLYDSVYQSGDSPPEEIIQDDDVLDGWLLIQNKDRNSGSRKKMVEGNLNKSRAGQAGEVYVVCDTIEDAKAIQGMNDGVSKAMIQSRENLIKKQGSVNVQEFSDIKQKKAAGLLWKK